MNSGGERVRPAGWSKQPRVPEWWGPVGQICWRAAAFLVCHAGLGLFYLGTALAGFGVPLEDGWDSIFRIRRSARADGPPPGRAVGGAHPPQPPLLAPPAGHPERLVPHLPPTPRERELWAGLWNGPG